MAKSPSVALDPSTQSNYEIWQQVDADRKRIQAIEMQYRIALERGVPFDPSKTEGSQTVILPDGNKLALTRPINYTVIKDIPTVQAALYKLHEINPALAQTIIRWEPVLNEGEYKKLNDDEKQIIASIITAKPGTIQLELRPPSKDGE